MQVQGTDGLSRGYHSKEVMAGHNMLDFVPLNLTASQRERKVEKWIQTITHGLKFTVLDECGWFDQGHRGRQIMSRYHRLQWELW